MKVVLYMAITANGVIAKKSNDVEWSEQEGEFYFNKVREIGNLVTGSVTHPLYELTDFADMGDPLVVVLTNNNKENSDKLVYANSPKQALKILQEKGFETALVAGGAKTNSSFLKKDLIDEIFLDIEPILYGDGIQLFSPIDINLKLKLLETKVINKNSLQLHYKVIK